MAESVSIDESDCLIEQANEAAETTEHGLNYIAVLGTLMLSNASSLTEHVDGCD